MLTKKQTCKDILNKNNIFLCQLCKETLNLANDILISWGDLFEIKKIQFISIINYYFNFNFFG